jgi:hypothetical protein
MDKLLRAFSPNMDEPADKPESTKDIQEILRQRRETLNRVKATLATVEKLQKDFEDGERSRAPRKTPPEKLTEIKVETIKLISIDGQKLTVALQNGETLELRYPSTQALEEDLKAFSDSAPSQDAQRLGLKAKGPGRK